MTQRWFRVDPDERAAAPVLLRELGVLDALRIGRRIRKRRGLGEPFAGLPAPDCEEERLSRAQIGPAVLLYREVRALRGCEEALRVTEAVVAAAAVSFLRGSLGDLSPETIGRLDAEGRERFVRERGARFFNAEMRWDEVAPERVRFTVTRCRFPGLCRAAGVPELAPVFCRADSHYFGEVEKRIVLERPHTIAEGGTDCPFTLRLRARDDR